MAQFDLIGFYDEMDKFYKSLEDLIGFPLEIQKENVNGNADYGLHRSRILADETLLSSLYSALEQDIRFYETLRAARAPVAI